MPNPILGLPVPNPPSPLRAALSYRLQAAMLAALAGTRYRWRAEVASSSAYFNCFSAVRLSFEPPA